MEDAKRSPSSIRSRKRLTAYPLNGVSITSPNMANWNKNATFEGMRYQKSLVADENFDKFENPDKFERTDRAAAE
jgi:hypothetical protein